MFIDFLTHLYDISIYVNLVCYLIIFLGGFYVALHSRDIPRWLVTALWYTGVFSFFTASTIILEFIYGQLFELSYFQVGLFGEIAMKVSLASIVIVLFLETVYKDYRGAKKRKTLQDAAD